MGKVGPKPANGMTITTHWPKTDPDRMGDYYDVTIDLYLDGIHYQAAYGDQYHDKGMEKAEGFRDALRCLYGQKFPVLYSFVADREEY